MNRKELRIQLRKELNENIWDVIFSTGILGLFKKGSKDKIKDIFRFNEEEFIEIDSFEEYDKWHTQEVNYLHQELICLYKENQKVDSQNPYTYTARLFNQYIKLYILQIVVDDPFSYGKFFELAHPIFSNKFIASLVDNIKSITEIDSKTYHDYVGLHRLLLKDPVCDEQAYQTITLIDGIDI